MNSTFHNYREREEKKQKLGLKRKIRLTKKNLTKKTEVK
jgi:hypothetical protein